MISALFTGSRVYGRPTKESDLDLVLLVTHRERELLIKMADDVCTNSYEVGEERSYSLRFGKLNVIAVTDPVAFAVFQKATKKLKGEGAVDRDRAVEVMKLMRAEHGLGETPAVNDKDQIPF
jgi:hypothetical protein